MREGNKSSKLGKRKKAAGRKAGKEYITFEGGHHANDASGRVSRIKKSMKDQKASVMHVSHVRKQIDPETVTYFTEIANLLESNGSGTDLEERSVICGNALEETKGKEVQLATDYVISHTIQTLLEGCDLDHLCGFLRSCAKEFSYIATDRSGSHVAETAIKSLSIHIQNNDDHSVIKETLTKICQAVVTNPVDVMCNCYGSHVLRSLLCLCRGVPVDSSELHGTKSSKVLAERLNFRPSQVEGNDLHQVQYSFPDLFKFLVFEMLNCTQEDIATLQVGQYSSLVLQTALKLFAGNDQELLHTILILLGCKKENIDEKNIIDITVVGNIKDLMKETAFSHLIEVILEMAPETLYNELFSKVFQNSLYEISSDSCGNFVIQALISRARDSFQMESIWEELGPNIKDLLEQGKSGVVASLIAGCLRLHTHENKCCKALAAAVCSANESPRCIIPRLLFLDSYFSWQDNSNWTWENGAKMHVMGSLILQAVFRFPSDYIQPYIHSFISMEDEKVLEVAKNAGGARVVEAFIGSNSSWKHKRKLVVKLKGHFGELSMHPSGSFTVEKCFTASNLSLKEVIVSELVAVRAELSKTNQGPHLLRKLDVDGFASRPEQWRSRQASKDSAYKEFYTLFGPNENKQSKSGSLHSKPWDHASEERKKFKMMRKDIENSLDASLGTQRSTKELPETKLGKRPKRKTR